VLNDQLKVDHSLSYVRFSAGKYSAAMVSYNCTEL
jgi:hypothetical protein